MFRLRRPFLLVTASLVSVVVIVASGTVAWNRHQSDERASRSPQLPATLVRDRVLERNTPADNKTAIVQTANDPILGNGEAVTFAFGGDVHFEGVLRTALDEKSTHMLDAIKSELSTADIAMVNLETAIGDSGTKVSKDFTFQAPVGALKVLAASGVDVATMANNHGVDFGAEGLKETLAAKKTSPIALVGIGSDEDEAFAPFTSVVRGQTISMIGTTDVIDDSLVASWTATDNHPGLASAKHLDRLLQEVRDVRKTSNTVVVFLHWGKERETCPTDRQEELVKALVDAGADIIVGSHNHRVVGAGTYERKGDNAAAGPAFVAYGLGNFVFYATDSEGTKTGVMHVTATGRRIDAASWTPAKIRSGVPVPLAGEARKAATKDFESLRACAKLNSPAAA